MAPPSEVAPLFVKTLPVMTGGSYGSLHSGYTANETSDLSTAC